MDRTRKGKRTTTILTKVTNPTENGPEVHRSASEDNEGTRRENHCQQAKHQQGKRAKNNRRE